MRANRLAKREESDGNRLFKNSSAFLFLVIKIIIIISYKTKKNIFFWIQRWLWRVVMILGVFIIDFQYAVPKTRIASKSKKEYFQQKQYGDSVNMSLTFYRSDVMESNADYFRNLRICNSLIWNFILTVINLREHIRRKRRLSFGHCQKVAPLM